MSNATNTRSEQPTTQAGTAQRSNLPPDGMEVRAVGNLTKDPYVGDKFTQMDVAFTRNHRKEDGTFEQGTPTFAKVVLLGEAHRNAPISELHKGTKIQAFGPMETEISKNAQTGKEYKDLKIKVFNGEDLAVLRQPKPKQAGAVAEQAPEADPAPAATRAAPEAPPVPAARQNAGQARPAAAPNNSNNNGGQGRRYR